MLIAFALLLFPARSAGREHRFSVGNFRCFSRRLLGQPSRLGFFPGLTLSFASCPFGSLPGGQLGRLLFPGRASGRFAFRYPAIAGGRDLVTSLEPLGAFGVFGHIFLRVRAEPFWRRLPCSGDRQGWVFSSRALKSGSVHWFNGRCEPVMRPAAADYGHLDLDLAVPA